MRRQSILFILVLLLSLFICTGCGSPKEAADLEPAAATEEAAAGTEDAAGEEAAAPAEVALIEEKQAASVESAEDVIGVFEGLEDNHTAIFSFDGVEKAFYFDTPEVQDVLWEAVIGSSYTLSYEYTETEFYRGLIISKISE